MSNSIVYRYQAAMIARSMGAPWWRVVRHFLTGKTGRFKIRKSAP